MGMNVGGGGEDEAMSNINTTPLVDVMLVLLIIFLITIPVITQTVKLDLPNVANQTSITKPDDITVAVDKDGQIYWNIRPITADELLDRLKVEAVKIPQPEVHIQGDREVRFEFIGKVMVMCQRSGIAKVGFISQPKAVGAAAATFESKRSSSTGSIATCTPLSGLRTFLLVSRGAFAHLPPPHPHPPPLSQRRRRLSRPISSSSQRS